MQSRQGVGPSTSAICMKQEQQDTLRFTLHTRRVIFIRIGLLVVLRTQFMDRIHQCAGIFRVYVGGNAMSEIKDMA